LSKKEKDFLLLSGYNSVIEFFEKQAQNEKKSNNKPKSWQGWVKSFIW
jgi:hypothetical protein